MKQRAVTPDWQAIANAWLTTTWQERAYYDRESGETAWVNELDRRRLQAVYDEVGEDAAAGVLDSAELIAAHIIEMDDDRFVRIPPATSDQLNGLYDDFAEACEPAFRQLLWGALDAADHSRFVRLLAYEPAEQIRWQTHLLSVAREALEPELLPTNLEYPE